MPNFVGQSIIFTLSEPPGHRSPWVSRFLQELGLRALVANPRKTRAIYQNERKSDRRDAMMLARLARMDPTLLHPIEHGSQEAQQDMLQLKLRDSLVRARVALINAVRFSLKSLGYPVSKPSSERFHKLVLSEVPESIGEMIAHNVAALAELTQRIKALEVSISRQAAERYPETRYLQQVSGVGPITSLYFGSKSGVPVASSERATSEPSWAYVRSKIKAERLIRNCAFPNAGTDT